MAEERDPKFEAHLRKISQYWAKFYNKLDALIKIEFPATEPDKTEKFDMEKFKESVRIHEQQRIDTIKKHISSTHKWVPGKCRWSKKYDNAYQSPLECSVCRMGASLHEEVRFDYREIDFENGELPSRDMHGQYIHRTCKEVQAARARARKAHKGGKCMQCSTYECWQEYDD